MPQGTYLKPYNNRLNTCRRHAGVILVCGPRFYTGSTQRCPAITIKEIQNLFNVILMSGSTCSSPAKVCDGVSSLLQPLHTHREESRRVCFAAFLRFVSVTCLPPDKARRFGLGSFKSKPSSLGVEARAGSGYVVAGLRAMITFGHLWHPLEGPSLSINKFGLVDSGMGLNTLQYHIEAYLRKPIL